MQEPLTASAFTALKIGIFAWFIGTCEYLGIPSIPFMLLSALMLIDFISGIAKSYSIHIDITSSRALYGIIKKMLTIISLISIAILLKIVGISSNFSLSVIIGMLATAEVFSTIQNIVAYRTRKNVSEFDATNFVLNKILAILKSKLEK